MRILDATCGNREMWFDKEFKDCVYMDIRKGVKAYANRYNSNIIINPDVQHDIKTPLPFSDGYFDLIIFDPPHVTLGKTGFMSKLYGCFSTQEIKELIAQGSMQLYRVLKDEGFLIFKWNTHDISVKKVLDLFYSGWKPLFGHKTVLHTKHFSYTIWITFVKKPMFDNGLGDFV